MYICIVSKTFCIVLAAKPRLETVENIMKMSPLIIQGLWEHSSPLLMLPHVAEQQLKHLNTRKVSQTEGSGHHFLSAWNVGLGLVEVMSCQQKVLVCC